VPVALANPASATPSRRTLRSDQPSLRHDTYCDASADDAPLRLRAVATLAEPPQRLPQRRLPAPSISREPSRIRHAEARVPDHDSVALYHKTIRDQEKTINTQILTIRFVYFRKW
jgi:hypothetical protein